MTFNLPPTWKSLRFGDVAKVITGTTPPTSNKLNYGGDIPFVGPADLEKADPIAHTLNNLSSQGAMQARLIPAESVLVCCIGSIGKVGFSGVPLATNQQINA